MASFKQYTASGGASEAFSIKTFSSDEIKVYVDNVLKTATTHYNITGYSVNGGTVTWTAGNVPNGVVVRIVRDTTVSSAKATYSAGSSIKADDLNDNQTQALRSLEEQDDQLIQTYDVEDAAITTAKIKADNITSALIADDQINSEHIAAGAVDLEHMSANSVDSDQYVDGSIDLVHMSANSVDSDQYVDGSIDLIHMSANSVDSDQYVDGSIDRVHLEADIIDSTKLADNAVDSEHYVDGSIDHVHLSNDCIDGDNIQNDVINSEHYVAGSIDTEHIADSQVTTAKIAADAITNAKIADNSIDSEHYVDGSIDTVHLADNSVTGAKLAAGTIGTADLADSGVTTAKIADANVTTAKIADSAITTAKIGDNAITTGKITDSQITTAKLGSNAVTTGKIADSQITTAKLGSNAITTGKIADSQITTVKIAADAIDGTKIADDAIGSEHLQANSVTTSEIADAELTTLAGMQAGTASILAGGTALTATLSEINSVCDGMGIETTISNTDVKYPTSGAVVDYVAAQIAPIGGLEVIATDAAFPNTQPSAGVVISIADAGGLVVNGSGTSTTGRTVGGSTVTINGINSAYNSTTVTAGVGFLVSSTGSGQIYNFHKSVIRDQDILSISTDIDDFANRYRVHNGEPSSNNDDGDLVWDTNANKMKVYDATAGAWTEVTSTGDFKYLFLCPAGGTGAPTLDGSIATYDLRESSNSGSSASVNSAAQLIVSINGVIQKANTGTSAPAEGFALVDANTIVFGSNLASGDSVFIVQIGSAVSIPTPGDNTVSTAKIQNLAVTTGKIADNAVTGAKLSDNLDLPDNNKIRFGTGNDLELYHDGSNSYIQHTNNGSSFIVKSDYFIVTENQSTDYVMRAAAGTAELYYDNSKKLETTSAGVSITGNLLTTSHQKITADNFGFWCGASDDLGIYHDGTNSLITNSTGDLKIYSDTFIVNNAANNENKLRALNNAAVELYYDNAKKFETDASGAKITGRLKLNDNYKVSLGDDADLGIYHDGSNSYISDQGTGELRLLTNLFHVKSAADDETLILGGQNGAVSLYYDNSKKLETDPNGVLQGDNSWHYWGDSDDLYIGHNGTDSYIKNATNWLNINSDKIYLGNQANDEAYFKALANGSVELYYNNNKKFETTSTGATFTGTSIVTFAGDDNRYIDFEGNGNNRTVTFRSRDGGAEDAFAKFTANGAVELYYDNTKKFETTGGGISVTGTIEASGNLDVPDWGQLKLGTGDDLLIYHNGSHSYIKNDTGELKLLTDTFTVNNNADNEQIISANADGAVYLFHNGSKKFETVAEGISVLGNENATAVINILADEGDDNEDKWRILGGTDGYLHIQSYKFGNWDPAATFYGGTANLNKAWIQAGEGGLRFDRNLYQSPTADQWSEYAGDGHLHRTDGQVYLSADDHFRIRKNGNAENKRFDLRTDTGNGQAQNDWQDDQFDFAEFFEWSDGNPDGEDRIGHTVAVDGLTGKIKIATEGDAVIGVVSGTAAFTANCAAMGWHGRYIRDEWGRYRFDLVKDEDGNQLYSDMNNKHEKVTMVENPDWDSSQEYYSRDERKEWDKIGIIGQCYVRKTAVIPSSWIKLKEVDSTKDFYLIK